MSLADIEAKIKRLVEKCQYLQDENSRLKTRCQELEAKNISVVTRVEQILGRLKSLEGNTHE